MRKIAEELGLNRMTVSAIINGKWRERGFSPKTRDRVVAYLEKRGYVPSRSALELREGTSQTTQRTGILFSSRFHPYVMYSLERIVEYLKKSSKTVEIEMVSSGEDIHGVRELVARRVDNLIWFYPNISTQAAYISSMLPYLGNFKHSVIYNYDFDGHGCERELIDNHVHLVGINRKKGFADLGRHFKKLGHKRVGLVGFRSSHDAFRTKGVAFYEIVPDFNDKKDFTYLEGSTDKVIKAVKEKNITAIYIHGFIRASNLVNSLTRKGVDISNELLVVGHDYDALPTLFPVKPLTMLRIPASDMIKRTISVINDDVKDEYRHCFNMKIKQLFDETAYGK